MTRIKNSPLRALFSAVFATAALVLLLSGAAFGEGTGKGRTDFQKLEGRWVRPDGGYVIELRDAKKDGTVTAAYFNPVPIRVHSASLARKNGTVKLYLELRDINYPGSIYRLVYDAAADRLKGTYFQAVYKQLFDVEFTRAR